MARPTLNSLLSRVDEHVSLFHFDYGGLPRAVEADEILREIWLEDTYHSSALEGNALSKKQVADLVVRGEASGRLSDALEVAGYSEAARWVYRHAQDYHLPERGVPQTVISHVHQLLMAPSWQMSPFSDGSRPGEWRTQAIRINGSAVKTTPAIAIESTLDEWVSASKLMQREEGEHAITHLARLHAWFERIHPFADGNGRTGRLVLNFMLLQRGYPPAVLHSTERRRYLKALAQSDAGVHGPLTEMLARAIETSINQFLIPQLAGDKRLVPLPALAEYSGYSPAYLRQLAHGSRLRATREGRIWMSSRKWVDEYKESRSNRGRRSEVEKDAIGT